MKYSVKQTALEQENKSLFIAIFENQELSPAALKLDLKLKGEITEAVKNGEVSGKIGRILVLRHGAQRIILVGCGKQNEVTERQYKQIIQKAVKTAKETIATTIINALTEVKIKDRDLYWNVRFAVETIEEDNYIFEQFKSKKSENNSKLAEIIFYTEENHEQAELAIRHATAISSGVKAAKDIANCPPNICNPAYLAEQANQLAGRSSLIETTVIGEKEMRKLGMNAYLAVSCGSKNEAKLSVMEYRNHENPNAKPIVLAGKGLTFDAGGISLKPAADMDEMKYDMCGAASVYGVMNAIAELQLPLNVIGVMAGCENLPDGNAYRPGDILTTMSGLTVEVLNTDAEGRLVLCDTLTYVERFEPELVIDVATLTGACVVALGQHNSGLVSTDDNLAQDLERAAKLANDKAWRLPLSEEYQEQLKSKFADLANLGGRWGGAITAGAFLSNFTKNYPWAHLDIAGTAWLQGQNKGATGRPVSLLVQFLLNQVK
ncbi:leucyl aminopeptidase [[Mannheimia] succiniciproducens]|uniref:Probable cytosol aminopeptidase n=1 Tax=Mannheimia succiniciproducens (strain KCTC 0769BP / MBEL55E) TaxID=221988 RepID=AMPA_MANSM|nr:leucyl aminopeptidase [[Mannheimia] succiniciproducens]Q65SA3.1 RecName: Full=Probable cytosol aminopeptidase; AltName: Full=Leucine aminopeptidase; Short=LAP; AltName: Full=Leucyl aminopeptidase [[Mannheimia] succiniciproducens MBEL55E]AAU38157.1 PepB protein [[Mannheimia] succiniciproducens MBEL55E]